MKFRKMVKKKIFTFTFVVISMLTMLTVCGEEQIPNKQKKGSIEENHVQSEGAFMDGADLQGSVVEFTEQGFSLSAATIVQENEGNVMAQAAPGAENEADLVEITYGENCEFQIITLDKTELTEVSREDTDRETIKKSTSVLVFGNCQDTDTWIAERVVILRWQ